VIVIVGWRRRRRIGRSSVRSRAAVIAASRCARGGASAGKGLGGRRCRRSGRRGILRSFGQASIRDYRTASPRTTSPTTRSGQGARTASRRGSRPQARTRMRPRLEVGTVGAKGDHAAARSLLSVRSVRWKQLEAMLVGCLLPIRVLS
jgi:hypothetical protein